MSESRIMAWHWLPEMGRLANGDKRRVVVGRTIKHKGPLVLCESGLHASESAFDALKYAPGNILCRVECGGEIVRGEDKLVCRERKTLAMVDAEKMLREFARKCALDVIHLWNAPDVVRQYLETGDETLRAAARDAAWDAALAAARAAARDAAWDAAWAAQKQRFEAMCLSLVRDMTRALLALTLTLAGCALGGQPGVVVPPLPVSAASVAGGRRLDCIGGNMGYERCEWNPSLKVAAMDPPRDDDCNNVAELCVGAKGQWHLCRSCAFLPEFRRYRHKKVLREWSVNG